MEQKFDNSMAHLMSFMQRQSFTPFQSQSMFPFTNNFMGANYQQQNQQQYQNMFLMSMLLKDRGYSSMAGPGFEGMFNNSNPYSIQGMATPIHNYYNLGEGANLYMGDYFSQPSMGRSPSFLSPQSFNSSRSMINGNGYQFKSVN